MLRVGLWGAAMVAVLAGVTGCSGGDTPTPSTLPTLTPHPLTELVAPTPLIQLTISSGSPGATAQPASLAGDTATYVQGAINLLASTLNIPPSSVTLLSINEAQWPDTSLGCPQPGQAYAAVLTSGYVIILKAVDVDYEVHVDQQQHYVACLPEAGAGATSTPPDPVAAEFIQQARVNLATLLAISPDVVVVVSSEARDWSDGNLGCRPARRGITPEPGPIPGYKIVLSANNSYYEYHASFDQIVYCKEPTE